MRETFLAWRRAGDSESRVELPKAAATRRGCLALHSAAAAQPRFDEIDAILSRTDDYVRLQTDRALTSQHCAWEGPFDPPRRVPDSCPCRAPTYHSSRWRGSCMHIAACAALAPLSVSPEAHVALIASAQVRLIATASGDALLLRVLALFNESSDVDAALQQGLDMVTAALAARVGEIWLRSGDARHVALHCSSSDRSPEAGAFEAAGRALGISAGPSLIGHVLQTGRRNAPRSPRSSVTRCRTALRKPPHSACTARWRSRSGPRAASWASSRCSVTSPTVP